MDGTVLSYTLTRLGVEDIDIYRPGRLDPAVTAHARYNCRKLTLRTRRLNMEYSKPWIFEEIGKGREEAYFRQKAAELIEELRRKFHEEQDRGRLAEEVGVHDEQILSAFEGLGFTRETVTILHLVPLVQVAWSDGAVSEGERSKILEIAALREVMPGTPGYVLLEKLLRLRPSEHAFDVCWRVIRAMFAAWPEEKRRTLERSLPAYAVEVASISGGLLGFRSISADERTALQRVAREIAEAHTECARTITAGATVGGEPARGAG